MIKEYLAKDILYFAKQAHQGYLDFIDSKGLNWDRISWDDLSDDLKYSNIRQIEKIETKLKVIDAYITNNPTENDCIISEFEPEDLVKLSIKEHELWVEEREESGWVYGPIKNIEEKISPYMVPWDQLDSLT